MRTNGDIGPTESFKMNIIRKLKPDLIIDDSPEVVEAAMKEGFTALQVHGFRTTKRDQIPFQEINEWR